MKRFRKLNSISVFFPCYNEEPNVALFLQSALELLPQVSRKFEIIVINDGSTDGTKKAATNFTKKYPEVRVVSHQRNLGYGAALRSGFKAARYDWVFFTDGDLQFKISQLKKFISYTDNFDIVIGYRRNRADGGIRAFNAYLFKLYIDLLFRVHVKDIDCAFKLMRAKVIKAVKLTSTGAFTSAELLYQLKKEGQQFKQLPVTHMPRRFGTPTGNHPRVIVKAGLEALKLYAQIKWESLRS